MSRDRLARALVRLYPRAWRQRYGDEFLALIADQGFSMRAAIDVVAAAALERARSFVALIRSDFDPQTARFAPVPFRETVREGAWFMALLTMTVGIVAFTGIPLPSWMWWYFTLMNWGTSAISTTQPTASPAERATLAFFWSAVAIAGAGLAWSIAGLSIGLGVPEPSEQAAYWSFGLFFGAVACRGIYGAIRLQILGGSWWEGMHRHEIDVWRGGLFVIVVLAAFLDHKAETFWSFSLIMAVSFRVPHVAMRYAAASRRPAQERFEETWAFKKADRS